MSLKGREYGGGRIASSMAAMFALNGGSQFVASGMIAIYLGSHAFVNDTHVGIIVAIASLVTAVAQPLWGVVADHASSKNRILNILFICIAGMAWIIILPKHTGFATLLPAIIMLYSLVYIPISLTDTIVVENMDKVRMRYGVIRAFGAFGAAFAAFMTFVFSDAIDTNPQFAYIFLVLTALLSLIPLRFIPLTEGHAHAARKKTAGPAAQANPAAQSGPSANPELAESADPLDAAQTVGAEPGRGGFNFAGIFKNKRMMLLLSYGLFTFICLSCQNTYFSVYFATDRGLNAGVGLYGLLFTVCIATEAIVMIFGSRLYSRLHIYTILTIVHVSAFARAFIIYIAPNAPFMFLMALFHGHVFGLLFLRIAPYIGSIVSDEMRATGQACWTVMFMGLGPVFGSLLGGLITSLFDIRAVFLFSAVALFLTTIVFFVLFRRRRAADLQVGYSG